MPLRWRHNDCSAASARAGRDAAGEATEAFTLDADCEAGALRDEASKVDGEATEEAGAELDV